MPGDNVPAIKVNTVGYPAAWRKLVIANIEPTHPVVENEQGETVLAIPPERVRPHGLDESSQDQVWQLDISDLMTPGTYRVVIGDSESDSFRVGVDVYREALVASQKMFYFQRTRTALTAPHAQWKGRTYERPGVSHAHDEVGWLFEEFPEKRTKWKVEAGWHDAGNFDMYVPSTAPSVQGLLLAYESSPTQFADGDTNIPESQNGIPDILDEAAWGLRWVLSMQAKSGGFRVREANAKIGEPGEIPADQDRTARWIDRVGSASTAKGCAMAAACARLYAQHAPTLANRCERAAQRAWRWLEQHPERVLVPPVGRAAEENPWQLWDDGTAVESDTGARFIAAAEMWRTFRTASALASVRQLMKRSETRAAALERGHWANLSRWGHWVLASDGETPEAVRHESRRRLLQAVEPMRERIEKTDGYRCATPKDEYYWGSNANLAEKGHLMLIAARLAPDRYGWAAEAAKDQWHWLLGRNPNGFSMVTQIGKGPRALYHMEWGRTSPHPPPGYLLDGPNSHDLGMLAPGAPAKALLWESPHTLPSGAEAGELWHWAQADLWESGFIPYNTWDKGWWCVTEPDIYYNAVFVQFATAIADSSVRRVEGAASVGAEPSEASPGPSKSGASVSDTE